MKKKLLKGLLWIALGYVVLVLLYFLYLEVSGGRHIAMFERAYEAKATMAYADSESSSLRNYASVQLNQPMAAAGGGQQFEQKYEKIASLSSQTTQFAEDEKRTREIVVTHQALIQEEAVNNYNGRNFLRLTIGVPPGEFDAIVADLQKVGHVDDFHVTKTDKTNDFLQLKAKRTTLEKARDALVGLKSQGGKIEELVKVEQEILKLEGEIQGLGVQLGQFDKVNEFCTVRFSLGEGDEKARSPHFGYLMEAIQWASGVYIAWLGIVCVGLIAFVLLLIVVEKSKIFRSET